MLHEFLESHCLGFVQVDPDELGGVLLNVSEDLISGFGREQMQTSVGPDLNDEASRVVGNLVKANDVFEVVGSEDFLIARGVQLVDGMISNANCCGNPLL